MMFISLTDNKDNRLSNFAENVEVHFAARKKAEILAKARNLLLQCDFSVPQVSFNQQIACVSCDFLGFMIKIFYRIVLLLQALK